MAETVLERVEDELDILDDVELVRLDEELVAELNRLLEIVLGNPDEELDPELD
jgi:hypothetical protein